MTNTVVHGQGRHKNNSKKRNQISKKLIFSKKIIYMVKKRILENILQIWNLSNSLLQL
jgi:hypothetical protein